jgi:hypothetical protein
MFSPCSRASEHAHHSHRLSSAERSSGATRHRVREGIYLRADDYQIVGLVTWLNRIPAGNRVLRDYAVRARFRELVSGIPVVTEWTLTNTFHGNRPPFVQTGKVTGITWQTGGGGKAKAKRRDRDHGVRARSIVPTG